MTEALSKLNFRDVGGLPTRSGGVLRQNVIYRSEGPASFGPVHREELSSLGIRLVCDLRADAERAKDPNDWAGSARLLNLDITADVRVETNEAWNMLKANPTCEAGREALIVNYAAIPVMIRPHLRQLIQAIVEGEVPVLIHCTAGKDRTGVLLALLLSGLGVPHDHVIADYQRSHVFADNMRRNGGIREQLTQIFGFLPSKALTDILIGVDRAFLEAALAAVDREWGGIGPYYEAAGIGPDLFADFRNALISPA